MKTKLFLAFLFLQTLPLMAATTASAPAKEKKNLAPAAQATPLPADSGIRTPFADEESTFYQKAWPIKKSHSLYALILMGTVLALIFVVLIRKMARSEPRKPQK